MKQNTETPRDRDQANVGILVGCLAYFLWGTVPLFWALIDRSGPIELLAHRIVWSVLFGGLALGFMTWRGIARGWHKPLARLKIWLLLLVAAIAVSINWGTYIYAITSNQVTAAALGYYINPIFSIALGVIVLRERLARLQWVAIGIAVIAVVVLTIEAGRLPWIALALTFSWGTYGLVKKQIKVNAVASMTVEALLLSGPALGYLIWLASRGESTFGTLGGGYDVLLALTGVVTAVPLILFSYAAPRITLSTAGMLQYIAPTCQFLLGVLHFGEHMSSGRWAGFLLVWIALIILTAQALHGVRARQQLRRANLQPPPS